MRKIVEFRVRRVYLSFSPHPHLTIRILPPFLSSSFPQGWGEQSKAKQAHTTLSPFFPPKKELLKVTDNGGFPLSAKVGQSIEPDFREGNNIFPFRKLLKSFFLYKCSLKILKEIFFLFTNMWETWGDVTFCLTRWNFSFGAVGGRCNRCRIKVSPRPPPPPPFLNSRKKGLPSANSVFPSGNAGMGTGVWAKNGHIFLSMLRSSFWVGGRSCRCF